MRLMGIEAIYPKKRLSATSNENKKYPYLLSGLTIKEPDHVWSTDITYIKNEQRVSVSCSDNRLVQWVCAGVGAIKHT